VAIDFKKKLEQQMGFLRRSCDSYDAGYTDESLRIAMVIRILIHDTKASTSLLNHLNAVAINLSSTVETIASPRTALMHAMGRLTISQAGATWKAATTPDAIKTQFPVSDWWNQIVYIQGAARLSRKDLVLAAADKDGGAHVDAELTSEYEALISSGERGFFHYSPTGEMDKFQPITDAHLVYIRQMGHELLSSPELLALTV
jgi:hypothetical protein